MAFFEKGADIQYQSTSIQQADRNYNKSCDFCCSVGLRMRCEMCPIEGAHATVVATLAKLTAGSACAIA